jgi:hypothetical protein
MASMAPMQWEDITNRSYQASVRLRVFSGRLGFNGQFTFTLLGAVSAPRVKVYWSIRRVLQQFGAFPGRVAACVSVDINHCVAVKMCLVCEVLSSGALEPRYQYSKPELQHQGDHSYGVSWLGLEGV